MYIRKGDGQSYEPDGNGSKDKERELTIQPGIIYDDLKPGEEIGMVKSDRPNPNLETFRNGQLRAVAAGSRLSFSSTARNYTRMVPQASAWAINRVAQKAVSVATRQVAGNTVDRGSG